MYRCHREQYVVTFTKQDPQWTVEMTLKQDSDVSENFAFPSYNTKVITSFPYYCEPDTATSIHHPKSS